MPLSEAAQLNEYAESFSAHTNLSDCVDRASAEIADRMGGSIDLLVAFVAGFDANEFDDCAVRLQTRTSAEVVLGCSCESAITGGKELQFNPAISLWAARLPGADILPMHLQFERSPDGGAIVGWPSQADGPWPDGSTLIALGEPFGFPMDGLLERLNEDRPGVTVIGGMASGAQTPGNSRLLLNDKSLDNGAVVLRVSGTTIRTFVSQGCRPIGEPMVITAAEQNTIKQLGGEPALLKLKKLFDTLPTREQSMVQNGLHVGRVISEYQDRFQFGDFLIRNVIGIDGEQGTISIGDFVRPGQTVQFHIRDHESASAEMRQIMTREKSLSGMPKSALLFTCNGRGTNLFPEEHHDAGLIQEIYGPVPLAGFFAAGEIGPVGGQSFLHGFTASVALFD